MAVNIQMRRDTAANWAAVNPLLAEGEWALELDTLKAKVGDGITLYNALPYWVEPAAATSAQPTSAQFSALSAKVEVVSNAVSVVSQALSIETAARVAADNTISNAASNAMSVANAASNAASIVSQALSVETAARVLAVNTVSTAASNALSVANAASNAASIVSAAVDVVSNALSAEVVARTAADNAVSAQAASAINVVSAFVANVSVKSVGGTSVKGLQSVVNALSNRLSAAGTGSVTSAEVQAVSAQAASAINVVSARVVSVSAELVSLVQIASAAATSADAHANTVSARVVSVSAELASLVQIASAAATSADAHANAASAAATSADAHANTVSARVVSVSAELASLVQIASAAATSADAHANTASAAATSVNARVTSVNAFISGISARSVGGVSTHGLQSVVDALSNRISAGGSGGSVTSAEVQAVSAQAASAINVVSARVVSVSAELASLVQIASLAATSADAHANAASGAATSVLNFVQGVSVKSVGGTSVKGLQSVVNALSNRISAVVAGAASVTSAELASVDARVNSVNTFLSGISARSVGDISTHGVQSVVNALSAQIAALRGEQRVLAATFTCSILSAIGGLSLSVVANGVYEIRAKFMVSATTGQPYFMRWSAPVMSNCGGFWLGALSVGVGGSVAAITAKMVFANFDQTQNNNTAFTCTRGATFNIMPVQMEGVFVVGGAGGQFVFKVGTATGQLVAVFPGSFSRAIRLA
jgi:hypothetical protein